MTTELTQTPEAWAAEFVDTVAEWTPREREHLTAAAVAELASLRRQRDELLAACKELLDHQSRELGIPISEMRGDMWGRARAAISAAEASE